MQTLLRGDPASPGDLEHFEAAVNDINHQRARRASLSTTRSVPMARKSLRFRIAAIAMIALGLLALPMVPLGSAVPDEVGQAIDVLVPDAAGDALDAIVPDAVQDLVTADEAEAWGWSSWRKKLKCFYHILKIGVYPLMYGVSSWASKAILAVLPAGWWAVAIFVVAHVAAFWHVRGIAQNCR